MTDKEKLYLAGIIVVGIIGYKVYEGGKKIVTQDLNPASDQNIVNRGVSTVVQDLTGFDNLGSWFYCKLHPQAYAEVCPDGNQNRPHLSQ